jgi:hypothetical protein
VTSVLSDKDGNQYTGCACYACRPRHMPVLSHE